MSWLINGVSLDAYIDGGLESATLTYRSRAADELVLVWKQEFDAALPSGFALGDTVTLEFASERRFVGRVVDVPRDGTSPDEECRVVVRGPWWWCENIVYQQEYRYSPADDYRKRPSYRLFVSRDGDRITTSAQIEDAVDYAIACGAPIALGVNPTGPMPPMQQGANMTCAEVLQRALRWTPDVCTRFDYSADPDPELSMIPWSSATDYTIAITSPNLVGFAAVPRPDLQIPGVRIVYENALDTDPLSPYPIEDVYPGGFDGEEPGGINLMLDLRGQVLAPTGLAQRYYQAFSTLQYSGRLSLIGDEDVILTPRPGDALKVTGSHAAWSTMRAQIQEVTHNLVSCSTELTFGPPEHLAIQDLVELLMADSRSGAGYILSTGKPAAVDTAGGPPFTILDASDEDGPKISVVLGLIGNLIPTLNGAPLTNEPRPKSLVLANDEWLIYVRVTTDAGGLDTAAAIIGSSAGELTDSSTYGHLFLGTVVVDAGAIESIKQMRTGNHFHFRCAGLHQWGT